MDGTDRGPYRPLADYGLIGDGASAALVASDGSIDWWSPSRFDAPSVFAAILDRRRGGFFRIDAGERAASSHAYLPRTNVLRTEFRSQQGVFEMFDFLPYGPGGGTGSRILRLLRGRSGAPTARVAFAPRFQYGAVHARFSGSGRTFHAVGGGETLTLTSPSDLSPEGGLVSGEFVVREGRVYPFALEHAPFASAHPDPVALDVAGAFESTVQAWTGWASRHSHRGPSEGLVLRSALTLKMLAYEATGAVVASPTCSLPEWIGGVRNWDYRYSWVRDAVFAVRALATVGHAEEAQRFVEWIVKSTDPDPAKLRPLYSVTGQPNPAERLLDHLEGYRGSRPVRVGNAAEHQFQLDVYGELVEGAYEAGVFAKADPDGPLWTYFRSLADHVATVWRTKDCGIWEVRCDPEHFVLSKVMSWVALVRLVEAAEAHGLPGDTKRWQAEADAIRAEVLEKGWSDELRAFKQAYGRPVLDAANLLLPIVGFLPASDPRVLATIDRTIERLTVDGLVYRYLDADDGLPGAEATFTYCTFWLVESLALAGRIEEATATFERVASRASPVGLFGEEIDPATGEHLGNYPQGFPHIGLIRAASALREARARGIPSRERPIG